MRPSARTLPFWFLLPAGICVTLFYLIPVVLTFVFSFTTMGSDTGILGNRFVVTETALKRLRDGNLDPVLIEKLGQKTFVFDDAGLKALASTRVKPAIAREIAQKLAGNTYRSEKRLLTDLKKLKNRPRSFTERKTIANAVQRTVRNREFTSAKALRDAFADLHIHAEPAEFEQILEETNTSWKWTFGNYRELVSSQFSGRILANTAHYVTLTLLFNIGLALVLALMTFYMPHRQAKFFRAPLVDPAHQSVGHLCSALEVVHLRQRPYELHARVFRCPWAELSAGVPVDVRHHYQRYGRGQHGPHYLFKRHARNSETPVLRLAS